MNRLGIFQMSDKDGIVEGYITCLLADLRENLDRLVVVVNGALQDCESEKLKVYADRIFYRENTGFDAYAFKQAVLEFIGLEEIRKYEELLLVNDTFYGPFYPFQVVFKEMMESSADFWGLTKHARQNSMREHIQSYFLVFRKKILKSSAFAEFWRELDIGDLIFDNLVHEYEVYLTDYFEKNGFSYEAYVKDDRLNDSISNNCNHYMNFPYTIVRKYKMPVLKRKVLTDGKQTHISAGEEIMQVFEYIKNCTSYEISLIWSDLLRKYHITDIKKNLNLNYVLPLTSTSVLPKDKRIAVIAHITYEELYEDCLEYLTNIPKEIDVYITSYKERIITRVAETAQVTDRNNLKAIKLPNRGRDVAAIFVGCRDIVSDYDYIGFVHDKKTTGNRGSYVEGASFQHLVWENMLKSEGYIRNIIELLENTPQLGLLSPPEPVHGSYSYLIGNEWTVNYDAAAELLRRMDIHVPLAESKHPFALSTCFWIRRKALNKLFLFPLEFEDFKEEPVPIDGELNHVLERILIYVAQDAGYFSGIVENVEYASLELENLHEAVVEEMNSDRVANVLRMGQYIGNASAVYLYGAGAEAKKLTNMLKENEIYISGYIISDEYYSSCNSTLKPLIRLCDCPKDAKIIVALNRRNSLEVKALLEEKGLIDVYYMNLDM